MNDGCQYCGKRAGQLIFCNINKAFLCKDCMRLFHPPRMTLIKFKQGNYKKLWNIEVGTYEGFYDVSDIEWCDWFIRSKCEVIYKRVPRIEATIYHLEFHGEVACGRCIDYPYFDKQSQYCMSEACQAAALTRKPESEREYPPERSRFEKWLKEIKAKR